MKKIIKSIIFLTIFCILFYFVFRILWVEPTAISKFYEEPKNSIDIAYIGGSNVFSAYNIPLTFYLYGYTVANVSSPSQSFIYVENLIKEIKKYQEPKLYIIDIAKIADDQSKFSDEYTRTTIDSMKFSKNRIDTINKFLSYHDEIDKKDYINYYFSFLIYHNSYYDYKKFKLNLIGDKRFYKGYFMTDYTAKIEPQVEYIWNENVEELQIENKEVLINLLDYIKENNINVLFVVPKRCFEESTQKRINDAINIIEENNFKVINCNINKELNNIQFDADFYNIEHLNVYGVTKYTLWFSKYLKENYDLPDHRNDKNYISYITEYERFKKDFTKLTNKNFDDLLLEYTNN